MSMEFKLNSMGSEGSLLLFCGGGAEVSSNFEPYRDARSSDEDELCEELKPE